MRVFRLLGFHGGRLNTSVLMRSGRCAGSGQRSVKEKMRLREEVGEEKGKDFKENAVMDYLPEPIVDDPV